MELTADGLDEFVKESDRLGGPSVAACQAYWQDFSYRPTLVIDHTLDPFGTDYAAQQMRLYVELAGHDYRPVQDEQHSFDIASHLAAINPYGVYDATMMGVHLQRLARAFSCAKVKHGELLLDMGCGWGLSSEVAAYMGLRVKGVDVNPSFVSLVNGRAIRQRYPITAVCSTFENYLSDEPVDLVLFYECLHHAVDPLAIVTRYAAMLRPGGRLILAGEPINAIWWPHWGIRLDSLSVYCIRKFGWFESGWSMEYIQELLRRAGLEPQVFQNEDGLVGPAIVGQKSSAAV